MKVEQIKTAEPFASLFAINPQILAWVQEDMQKHGFDASQPLIMWAEPGVVVDGHTRLEAAKNIGLEEIPVHEKNFADEDEALAYAIHNQRHRRNLTDTEILRCIEALDRRKARGGDHKSDVYREKSKAPNGALDPNKKSAAQTAKLVGTSPRKVERARTALNDPQAASEVKAGKKTISRAYQEIQAKRKSQHQTETSEHQGSERRAILQQALKELRPWREKYKDYPEFSAVFQAIDDCRLDLEQKEAGPQAEEAAHAPEKPGPCPPVGVEGDCENPQLIGAVNNESPQCPSDAESTGESVPSTHETGAPEPEGQAADSKTSGRVGDNLKMCSDCRHFKTSPDGDGQKGTCKIYPKWVAPPVFCPS
jgi:hypothetical protein